MESSPSSLKPKSLFLNHTKEWKSTEKKKKSSALFVAGSYATPAFIAWCCLSPFHEVSQPASTKNTSGEFSSIVFVPRATVFLWNTCEKMAITTFNCHVCPPRFLHFHLPYLLPQPLAPSSDSPPSSKSTTAKKKSVSSSKKSGRRKSCHYRAKKPYLLLTTS